MRSPIPLDPSIAAHVTESWRNHIAAQEPQKAAAWRVAADATEWAEHVVSNVAVPYLARDQKRVEDLDSSGPDHGADACRYGILRQRPAMTINIGMAY